MNNQTSMIGKYAVFNVDDLKVEMTANKYYEIVFDNVQCY